MESHFGCPADVFHPLNMKSSEVLDEIEERDIIRKSSSEFSSPLVLVWKKSGDQRICNDFRWLNARTIKDAHSLPHPADAWLP